MCMTLFQFIFMNIYTYNVLGMEMAHIRWNDSKAFIAFISYVADAHPF